MTEVKVTKDRYTTNSLYQYDYNQDLAIYGLSLPSIPEIHFANAVLNEAIVKQATMDSAGVVRVDIPNEILTYPNDIDVYVCIYEGDAFRVLYKFTIPVNAKKKPANYIASDDEKIYSYNALENKLDNTLVLSLERYDEVNTKYDEVNTKYENALDILEETVDKITEHIRNDLDWFGKGTSIPENADLDTYQILGKFYCSSESRAKTLDNCPTTTNFSMWVFDRTGYTSQLIITLGGKMYIRSKDSSKWRAWIAYTTSEEIEELMTLIKEELLTTVESGMQSDWEQLDETKSDFIKNKPFGTVVKYTTVYADMVTAEYDADFKYSYALCNYRGWTPAIGEKYLVSLNGEVEYELTVNDDFNMVADDVPMSFELPQNDSHFVLNIEPADDYYLFIRRIDETLVKIDKKYLPDDIFESVEQSDWKQNDPSKPGYIKNRPFGEVAGSVVFPETSIEIEYREEYESSFASFGNNGWLPVKDKVYTVKFNDTEYTCIAHHRESDGEISWYLEGVDTSLYIEVVEEDIEVYAGTMEVGNYIFSILEPQGTHIKKLDPKYLPDELLEKVDALSEEIGGMTKIFYTETGEEHPWDGLEQFLDFDISIPLVAGNEYAVTIDGIEHTVTATEEVEEYENDEGNLSDAHYVQLDNNTGWQIRYGEDYTNNVFGSDYNTLYFLAEEYLGEESDDGFSFIPHSLKIEQKGKSLKEIAESTIELNVTYEDGTTATLMLYGEVKS